MRCTKCARAGRDRVEIVYVACGLCCPHLLLRSIEYTYASTPTLDKNGVAVTTIDFTVKESALPANLKKLMFPKKAAPATPAALPAKKKRKLGEGAYICSTAPKELKLAAQASSSPQPMLQLTAAAAPSHEEKAAAQRVPLLPVGQAQAMDTQ